MLTPTLRSLERDGLVSRQICAAVPPRVEYTLTPLGQTFTGPLRVLEAWAETHVEAIEASRAAWDVRVSAGGEERYETPAAAAGVAGAVCDWEGH